MNKINYILITLLLGGSVSLNAQTSKAASEMQLADTLSIGYQMNVSSHQQLLYQRSQCFRIRKIPVHRYQQSFVWKSGRSECISGYRLVSR